MYIPTAFVESDVLKLHRFIESHSFGTLVSQHTELMASHLPFLLDRDVPRHGQLIGHMARANPQWQQASDRCVLVIFSGPHAYISPRWYAAENAENVVPTWNYVAVHVYGTLRLVDEQTELAQILRDTVARYEHTMPQPWTIPEPDDVLGRLMQMIVGFRIDIERIEGKWKLSQNHPPQRRERVVEKLLHAADPQGHEIAQLMEEQLGSSTQRETQYDYPHPPRDGS